MQRFVTLENLLQSVPENCLPLLRYSLTKFKTVNFFSTFYDFLLIPPLFEEEEYFWKQHQIANTSINNTLKKCYVILSHLEMPTSQN